MARDLTTEPSPETDRAARLRRWTRRRLGIAIALAVVAGEALMLRSRGYGLGGDTVVRCRRGHPYTTLWIPGVSITSVRRGWGRSQWCPVGRHWSLVTPAVADDLTPVERRNASVTHDLRLP
jgi:hypothetical protein